MSPLTAPHAYDVVLVGGGLQNGLLALALFSEQPGCRVALVEAAERLGGNHTWCFHTEDVPPAARHCVAPLVVTSWPGYEVRFDNLTRSLAAEYSCTTGTRLHQVLAQAFENRNPESSSRLFLGARAATVEAHDVTLADGTRLRAPVVIDSRGPPAQFEPSVGGAGYQKFLGHELRLDAPHGLTRPLLMDATVEQYDGYRFVYVLPLTPDTLLVEDTYFSDGPELDASVLHQRLGAYASDHGWVGTRVREEAGVLPLPWAMSAMPSIHLSPLRAGYGGGWFHPGTGYSFPVALRLAWTVARSGPGRLTADIEQLWRRHAQQLRFMFFLNRMLFRHCPGPKRRLLFERFYRLPADTIHRFYALDCTFGDRMRILCGRPPRGLQLKPVTGALA